MYRSKNRALAIAIAESEVGDHVILHSPKCRYERVGHCTCIPTTLVIGAKA